MVLNHDESKILMCYRSKNPYKSKYNLVGGKIEENEDYLKSAYRELWEETGIENDDIELQPFIDFTWHPIDMKMFVYIGKLKNHVNLVKEIHELTSDDRIRNLMFFVYKTICVRSGKGNWIDTINRNISLIKIGIIYKCR